MIFKSFVEFGIVFILFYSIFITWTLQHNGLLLWSITKLINIITFSSSFLQENLFQENFVSTFTLNLKNAWFSTFTLCWIQTLTRDVWEKCVFTEKRLLLNCFLTYIYTWISKNVVSTKSENENSENTGWRKKKSYWNERRDRKKVRVRIKWTSERSTSERTKI